MLSFRALFARYRSSHRRIELGSRNLGGGTLDQAGRIERTAILGNQIVIEGWSYCSEIEMSHGDQQAIIMPMLPRADVKAAFGGGENVGFIADFTYQGGPIFVEAERNGDRQFRKIGRTLPFRLVLEDVRLGFALGYDCFRSLPLFVRWMRAGSAADKQVWKDQIKSALRLGEPQKGMPPLVDAATFQAKPKAQGAPQSISIILPVYNAFDVLQICLERVFANTDVPWRLIVLNDCSTDERVKPFLELIAGGEYRDRITLLHNAQNLGFIATVNRGFDAVLDNDDPVVLLNSDALVPNRWATRLIAPLADATVASVTAMSNDAEILGAPHIVTALQLEVGTADRMDSVAESKLINAEPVEIPTGVGFCMAISNRWLKQVPTFDTTFGRGYGEEVDWCRKIKALGGIHVAQPSLFVEHRGGQSFGYEEKLERITANNKVISSRYPDYDALVQAFIANDPLIGGRMVLGLAWAAAQQNEPVSVFLTHSMGGGAADATEREITGLIASGQSAVVVRVGGRTRFVLELRTGVGESRAAVSDVGVLDEILSSLEEIRVVYSCGVGAIDPVLIPDQLISWASKDPRSRLEIQFHDFFPISPSYTLLDGRGEYHGAPTPDRTSNAAHQSVRPDNTMVDLKSWQDAWGEAVRCADVLTVYSRSSAAIVTEVWPAIADKLAIIAHDALFDVPRISRAVSNPPKVIGILGNIGFQKGAKVVADFAAQLGPQSPVRFVLIGNIDPQYALPRSVIIHGNYKRQDIAKLAERYQIDCWLIPSIWPETFSFTTHEALASGLPVWCFDIGAQADAVRAAVEIGNGGGVIPLREGHPVLNDLTQALIGR